MLTDVLVLSLTIYSVIHYQVVNDNSTYLSLTLGWTRSTLTLVKRGMNDGDNAIFKIYKVDGTDTEYMTVILTDRDKQADGSRVKEITLNSDGVWKVVETSWSWAYTPENDTIQKTLNINSTAATGYSSSSILRFPMSL